MATWAVLGAGILGTLLAWTFTVVQVRQDARTAFESATRNITGELRSRIDRYNNVLYGLQGLLQAAGAVDHAAFTRAVDHLRLDLRHPGLRSVSYSEHVPQRDRAAFEARLRADPGVGVGVGQDFTITPTGTRNNYLVLLYRQPAAARDIGTDLAVEAAHRAYIERARDTGIPTASTPASPAVGSGQHADSFALHLAVYRPGAPVATSAQRSGAFSGLLSITFGTRALVDGVLGDLAFRDVRLRIRDHGYLGAAATASAASDSLVYGTALDQTGSDNLLEHRNRIEIGQREWLLEFGAPRALFLSPAASVLPWIVLFGGLAISGLLFGLVRSAATSWQRATDLAHRMTQDLRVSEARLSETQRMTQQLIEALPNPIFFMSPDGRYLGVNKAWETFFGVQRASFIGRTVHDLYPHDRDTAHRLNAMDQELWQQPGTQMHEAAITTRDGRNHDVIYYKATYTRADGAVAGLVGTIIDITERKRTEKRQAVEQAVTRILAEARTPTEAVQGILRDICEIMEWQCGARWNWDEESGLLKCCEGWSTNTPRVREFMSETGICSTAPEPPGQGFVRRIYADGRPMAVAEIAHESGYRRAAAAARAGLRGAFGIPLRLGTQVLGVMEFYSREAGMPDALPLDAAASIGSQIGQYIVRKQAEETATFVATHDVLTDLPNRSMFNERLSHAIVQARRHSRRLAVLFIDLDRFKVINDTLGHDAGDALLRDVAARLGAHLRSGDTVARLGGDEFVVLAEDVSDPVYIGGLANRLIAALAGSFVLEGQEFHITASIGVSTFPDDGADAQTLLKNADIAMYRAKEQGKNAFQFYSTQMNVHSVERLALESALRRAMERDELVLHYQPQLDIRSGRITGLEALLRWHRPEIGLVSPARFIPLAEETGLIVPIGIWVLQTACATQLAWRKLGLPPVRIAVNLSARQFSHGDLMQDITRILAHTGCDVNQLELEITESMVMLDPERAVAQLRQIKEMGAHVAIDDFGTGYSSLAYLKRFPIDSLKIDRSFIQDVAADRGDAAITRAVIGMAHSLALRVVAEGVETREQFEFLRDHDCDEMQGYYFSPPLTEQQTTELLRTHRP